MRELPLLHSQSSEPSALPTDPPSEPPTLQMSDITVTHTFCCPWHAVVAWLLLLLAPYCLFGLFELAMQQQQHHHAMRWIRGS